MRVMLFGESCLLDVQWYADSTAGHRAPKAVSKIDVEVVQSALEKSRDKGWPVHKSQTIRCDKDGTDIIARCTEI